MRILRTFAKKPEFALGPYVVYATLVCLIGQQNVAFADAAHDEGIAAGAAAGISIRGMVNTPNAQATVPGYTTTPPETVYYGQPNLSAPATARLALCSSSTDPTCQASSTAIQSAITPRTPVGPYDPSVVATKAIVSNPTSSLGDLSQYYSSCTTTPVAGTGGTENKLCNRYVSIGNVKCSNFLHVAVDRTPNCQEGDWAFSVDGQRNGADHVLIKARCDMAQHKTQVIEYYAYGEQGDCGTGWQITTIPTTIPQLTRIGTISPHWDSSCRPGMGLFALAGSGCNAHTCDFRFQYGYPVYSCPFGQLSGDKLMFNGLPGDPRNCYSFDVPTDGGACVAPAVAAQQPATAESGCASQQGAAAVGVNSWGPTIDFNFPVPGVVTTATDGWDNQCAILETTQGQGTCTRVTAPACVDGPTTHTIAGDALTRACWQYQSTYSCANAGPSDECAPLASSGCSRVGSRCAKADPNSGICQEYTDTYQCPVAATASAQVTNCATQQFCVGNSCFNTASRADGDFAHGITMLEAAREAGVYMDPKTLQVFQGVDAGCRDRLLKNCCYTNGAGAGMSNQSVFGTGSRFVYDMLFDSDNREFLTQGLNALINGAGFSGTYSSYGFTVAVNGAAIPAGDSVIASVGSAANGGTSVVVAFDPWSLVIAVIIYVVMQLMTCNENEGITAMKKGAHLCHDVGSYCSSNSPFGCLETTTRSCCFNSVLARVINEQGRSQIGKGWGTPEAPECSGFTIAQLQTLNFASMDLSEVYASVIATMPNVANIQNNAVGQAGGCYYGQGKCGP
jgi:conjugal transfer mating pair stabilization protein TraN